MSEPAQIGSEVGGYRIIRELGRGGMGTVFVAERVDDGYEVALKVLSPKISANPEFRKRFVREAQYADSIDHPNIVRILGSGDADGVLWAAMDLIEGSDLAAILASEGPQPPKRVIALLEQVANALDAVHEAGLLHRDVKAANVLIEKADFGERAFLADFGLAKNPGGESQALTAAGFFVGTSAYCAPEQILGKKDVDRRVDVYSLGCLLFECLVGEPPFTREREVDVMHAHLGEEPPRASERMPSLAAGIDEVIGTGLAKDPGDRFESCGALIAAAEEALAAAPTRLPTGATAEPFGENVLLLEAIRGESAGTTIPVVHDLLIGRESTGEGRLADDQEISRKHAHIWLDPEYGWRIEDLGSTNGSFLNGEPITEPQTLSEGDLIELGATTLKVAAIRADAGEPAALRPPSQITPPASRVASAAEHQSEQAKAPEADRVNGGPAPEPGEAPTLALGLEVDLAAREARISLGTGGERIRVVFEDGAWRLADRTPETPAK